jgi:hypothetical protein
MGPFVHGSARKDKAGPVSELALDNALCFSRPGEIPVNLSNRGV